MANRYFIIFIILCVTPFAFDNAEAGTRDGIGQEQWGDVSSQTQLLETIRKGIAGKPMADFNEPEGFSFDPNCSAIAVTLFQTGNKPLRWIASKSTFKATLGRVVELLGKDARIKEFAVDNGGRCRILFEMITSQVLLDVNKLTDSKFCASRFEPGITGFKLVCKDKTNYYMPTDAVVQSHMTITQALNYFAERVGIGRKTNRISQRIEMLRAMQGRWYLTQSRAFVSWQDKATPLYRGYPAPVVCSRQNVLDMTRSSIKWLLDNMGSDGRFLYYYDGVRDSVIDHVHPDRDEENNYYNILRHGGGIIALLRMNEIEPDKKYISAAGRAVEYLVEQMREQDCNGQKAYYVFENQKAKLGGSGIGLTALLRYKQATGEKKFDKYIHGLANHVLSRICDDGEMIGYYIHPLHNGGKPIIEPNESQKRQLFSFYYPGEAMLGLALYDKLMKLDKTARDRVREQSRKALDFLVLKRPVKYKELFEPLPSDGWLMQAIEQWAEVKGFDRPEYLDFVFNDANAMINHMYTFKNSPYYDYLGTFYYHYGDHAYIDGARGEGLIGAYYLAEKMGHKDLADYYLANCKIVARSLVFSYNSPQSTYFYKQPHKAIGSFRFKLTRQWMRVDTVQHTACYYVRLLKAMGKTDAF